MFFVSFAGSTWKTKKGLKIDSDETIGAQQDITNDAEQSFYFVIYNIPDGGSNASV